MLKYLSLDKLSFGLVFAVSVCLLHVGQAGAADQIKLLQSKLSQVAQGERAFLDQVSVRDLYLEDVKLKSHGVNFFNGCQEQKLNKHKLLPINDVPVVNYKGIPIVGSPYFSIPVVTKKNNNALYIQRLKRAIDLVETHLPKSFAKIQRTMRAARGYMIIDNICPTQGALAYAAFVPRLKERHFVVLVSSTLLLVDDLFSDYDVAAQLVHEMEGHAVQFFQEGTTDEINAFTKQAAFAQATGNDKFKDVNNRAQNIKSKIKLSLSTTGTYVKNKTDVPSFSVK
ncbi:hypothetical protein V5T82_08640 [Magnetovibrio sp. PR-2]|uniref:hypothetical protein n=1 Tax=Magnetovibrio sp. PR-2 TaxID=3120356 RepID=UPI002FCE0693